MHVYPFLLFHSVLSYFTVKLATTSKPAFLAKVLKDWAVNQRKCVRSSTWCLEIEVLKEYMDEMSSQKEYRLRVEIITLFRYPVIFVIPGPVQQFGEGFRPKCQIRH